MNEYAIGTLIFTIRIWNNPGIRKTETLNANAYED